MGRSVRTIRERDGRGMNPPGAGPGRPAACRSLDGGDGRRVGGCTAGGTAGPAGPAGRRSRSSGPGRTPEGRARPRAPGGPQAMRSAPDAAKVRPGHDGQGCRRHRPRSPAAVSGSGTGRRAPDAGFLAWGTGHWAPDAGSRLRTRIGPGGRGRPSSGGAFGARAAVTGPRGEAGRAGTDGSQGRSPSRAAVRRTGHARDRANAGAPPRMPPPHPRRPVTGTYRVVRTATGPHGPMTC